MRRRAVTDPGAKPASETRMKNHRCRKEDIDWDRKISDRFITEDGLGWFGKCRECGRKVYEIYAQLSCLHDADTHEDLTEICEET